MQSIVKNNASFLLKCFNNLEQVRFSSLLPYGQTFPVTKYKVRPVLYYSLEERLKETDPKEIDPERYRRINIGCSPKKPKARDNALAKSKLFREIKDNIELEKKSRSKELLIDLDTVEEEWNESTRSSAVQNLADHFKIFEHLFGPYAFFEPYICMNILYDADGILSPVYVGNLLKPAEVPAKPQISFESEKDDLWTLILTNPDGNLYENDAEMIHWAVTNIPGGRVNEGEEIVPYMAPLPPKGTGFHRYIFVLYKQEKKLDLSKYSVPSSSSSLESRTFRNEDFYRENQDHMTPAGLSWFQADWDTTINGRFYELGLKAPLYLYEFPKQFIARQKHFPKKKSFNRYMDLHRPKKELQERLLLMRLARTHPINGDVPLLPFPQAERKQLPIEMPIWQKKDLHRQWDGEGMYKDIYRGDDRPFIEMGKKTPLLWDNDM